MKIKITLLTFVISTFLLNNLYSFNLTVTTINETCVGNGQLNFNVSNTDPNGTIVYVIYLLPYYSLSLLVVSLPTFHCYKTIQLN